VRPICRWHEQRRCSCGMQLVALICLCLKSSSSSSSSAFAVRLLHAEHTGRCIPRVTYYKPECQCTLKARLKICVLGSFENHECQVQHGCVRALSSMQRDRYARKHALKTLAVVRNQSTTMTSESSHWTEMKLNKWTQRCRQQLTRCVAGSRCWFSSKCRTEWSRSSLSSPSRRPPVSGWKWRWCRSRRQSQADSGTPQRRCRDSPATARYVVITIFTLAASLSG